jgi:hypothetical protein
VLKLRLVPALVGRFGSSTKAADTARADAARLLADLKALPLRTPRAAQRCTVLEAVRAFEKRVAPTVKAGDSLARTLQELGEHVVAARLGLTRDALLSAEGLAELAAADRIYNHLARYDESCVVVGGEVHIKFAGALTPWSQIPAPLRMPRSREHGEPWPYDATGLCDRHMDVWPTRRLEPFFYADPASWGGGHVLAICTTAQEQPRLMERDHAFIRLYDPEGGRHAGEGAIFSFGFYRPAKRPGAPRLRAPLRVQPGRVRLDFSEFWGEDLTELRFRITREQMARVVARAEADHARGVVPFQLGSRNCTWYALDAAAEAGVHVDATMGYARMLFPRPLGRAVQRAHQAVPSSLRPFITPVSGLFWNSVQMVLGAHRVEPSVRAVYPEFRPTFTGWGDALRRAGEVPQSGPSPWRLGREVTPRLLRERAAQGADSIPSSSRGANSTRLGNTFCFEPAVVRSEPP